MSNYYCPRCGKAIIDNGGATGVHWCTSNPDIIINSNNIGEK